MAKRSNAEDNENLSLLFQNYPEEALKDLYHSYHAALTLFAYRITDNQAAAEDIAEEAFIVLWNKRDSLSEIRSIKSYLYRIVRNGCLNWIRKTNREIARHKTVVSMEEDFVRPVIDSMIFSETMGKIYAAMDKLPAQCRRVFMLHYIEGKKLTEIAEELKISINTVKTHKVRGIELLKGILTGFLIWVMTLR